MRAVCLAVCILLTGPALLHAQGLNPATGARPGHSPGEGVSWPLSPHASHIGPSHIGPGGARSPIAPALPEPAIRHINDALRALAAGDRAGALRGIDAAFQVAH